MFKKSLFLLGLMALALSAQAQGREGLSAIEAASRWGRYLKVASDAQIGLQALQTGRKLGRGIKAPVPLKGTVPLISSRIAMPAGLADKVTQATLPGYFNNFGTQFRQYADEAQISPEYWNTWLGRAFASERSFNGYFVPSFKQAVELLDVPVTDGVDAITAVEKVLTENGAKNTSGFFVLAEEGDGFHPKDVFILDIPNSHWISLNASRGHALSGQYAAMWQQVQTGRPKLQETLQERGVLVRVDHAKNPTELEVSKDGVMWDRYSMQTVT
ncbi:MAG: hypothetical protein MJ053_06370, partial [Elusimicrobiaceae bacterium]|nr:hypothetical protein [Elusimicrobiaceae bacterium]